MSRKHVLLSILAVAMLMVAGPVSATGWDLVTDFVCQVNPNGAWTYGHSQTLGSTFVAFPDGSGPNPSYPGLYSWTDNAMSGFPMLIVNTNPTDQQSIWPPLTAAIHPGTYPMPDYGADAYGIARWTAPTAGDYLVVATFGAAWAADATTDVHVLRNGVSVFDDTTAGGATKSFSATLSLGLGETIDAAVGPDITVNPEGGFFGSYVYDTTPVTFTITQVPEPSSIAVLLCGSAGLISVLRRRRA